LKSFPRKSNEVLSWSQGHRKYKTDLGGIESDGGAVFSATGFISKPEERDVVDVHLAIQYVDR